MHKKRIPWSVAARSGVKFDVETLLIDYWISHSRLQKICKLFEANKCKVMNAIISQRIQFEPKDLEYLIKATKLDRLIFYQFVPKHFFFKDIFDKIFGLCFDTTGFGDEELLAVKFKYYWKCRNDFVTAKGLNKFLKWKRRERKFESFSIEFDNSFNSRPFEIILEGLAANPIWTPDLHEQSLIAKLPIQQFSLMETGDPTHFYALWRSEKLHDVLILKLQMGSFCAYKSKDPSAELLLHVTSDQFFELFKICKYCLKEECRHRRKYSTHKLRKNWPKVWRTLIFSMRIARWTTIPFHYSQAILNPFRAVNRPKMEEYKRHFHEENPQNWVHRNWLHFEFLVFRT